MHLSRLFLVLCTLFRVDSLISGQQFYDRRELELHFLKNDTIIRAFDEHVQKFNHNYEKTYGYNFNCTILRSEIIPDSVHQLRPGDIDVVAALGDSLTAGTGIKAKTLLGLLVEFRGLSWSIGGDGTLEDSVTLPNILKYYNPNLRGYSVRLGTQSSGNAHLNVAFPGAKVHNLPSQARLLVRKLHNEPGVDMQKDWKVITLFIGANDLCDYCLDRNKENSVRYIDYIRQTLDVLHASVPRAFVNLVPALDVSDVSVLNAGLVCSALHLWKCKCGAYPESRFAHQELVTTSRLYQQFARELVASGRYDTRDDFTVVVQTFTQHARPPTSAGRPDLSFFAPDCFHLSEKGQSAAAISLWNNMVQPVGRKQQQWFPDGVIRCPTKENPFFFTSKNSKPHFGNYIKHGSLGKDDIDSRYTGRHLATGVGFLALVVVPTSLFFIRIFIRS